MESQTPQIGSLMSAPPKAAAPKYGRSKYMPHQGKREMARRVRQLEKNKTP